jgi:hypothetical protein
MKPSRIALAAFAVLHVAARGVLAQESPAPTALDPLAAVRLEGPAAAAPAEFSAAPAAPAAYRGGRLDAVRYRPRYREGYRERSGGYVHSSPAQIHAGFFDPEGNGATSFAIGFRGGPAVDEHIQLGFGADWYHKSESRREVQGTTFQGGQPVTVTRVLARASSNLFPFQAYLQVSGGDNLSVIPYFGVAGEYQVLLLSATDYQTGADFDATFGGWGWQVWGGAALPLSGRSRMFGEVFVNNGDVERDVDDPASGVTFRESVNADGVGMRFGLSWGF